MNIYTHLLFDLDGTLTDPAQGITRSVAYALRKFGIEETNLTELYPFIGPPLIDSFIKFYGLTPEQARQGVTCYREYFVPKGMYENTVYPGVKTMLADLKRAGYILLLATSKPEPFARDILAHFSLDPYFDFVCGASLDETRTAKPDVIRYALETAGFPNPASCLMIGDREHDVLGAKACGIASAGVLYGYGSREELESAGADYICATVEELREVLLRV